MSSVKLTRQRKTKDPCEICMLHKARCICAAIPKLDLKTRVTLVIHAKELKRTTNTGRLAMHALVNSEMHVRGERSGDGASTDRLDLSLLLNPNYESVLLYPSEDAIEISELRATKPIQLIVPDGNWRQAGKVAGRHPELKELQRVKLSDGPRGTRHLRKEHFEGGLSTLEAVARALEAIEGKSVGAQLMALYLAKLNATLIGRGESPL